MCVPAATAASIAADNLAGASRVDPVWRDFFRSKGYGPNTCKAGKVWREADAADWVCVDRATRTQVLADNAAT